MTALCVDRQLLHGKCVTIDEGQHGVSEQGRVVAAIERAQQLAAEARFLLVVGSSLEVYPVAGLPEQTLAAGGCLAIVNRGSTPWDAHADVVIDGGAGETLSALSGIVG